MLDRERLIERITDEVWRRVREEERRRDRPGADLSDLIGAGADRVGIRPGGQAPAEQVAALIDHTLLKPDATRAQIEALCAEAARHRFKSVCVNPTWVAHAARRLTGSGVAVCTVIGFPLGANVPEIKAAEARRAQDEGASELDMVVNVGRLKSGEHDAVRDDIAAVTGVRRRGSLVKVILETCLLTDEEKRVACRLAREAGADFVKTSTGFSSGGATAEDIRLMRESVGSALGVKASGGVRNREDLVAMVRAGASRIGASAGVKIVSESRS